MTRCRRQRRASTAHALAIALVLCAAASGAILAPARAAEVVVDIALADGRAAPEKRLVRAAEGDTVRLRWTSDRPIVLHLHGYDITTEVQPGGVAETLFTARATGRFPVEEHRPSAERAHAHGEAPILRIEVRPR